MTDTSFEEYRKEYLDDVRINAQIEGVTPDEYFFTDALDKLSSMGELTDPRIRPTQKRCRNNKIMSFDAYGFDESDKSFVLISNDFKDTSDATLTRTEMDTIRTRMLNFLQEAYDERLLDYFDITDEMVPVGRDVGRRMKKDYVDLDNDDSINQIKLFIITNKILSEKVTSFRCDDFLDKKVELNVWSIKRFFDLYQSGKDREPILIETSNYGLAGIPCIQAEMSGNLDYDAYLAIVPGSFLHSIYYEHGSRLLEGNVRAFLSTRGKINKGIRETIRKEPTKFFTYNNGIACTAAKVKLINVKKRVALSYRFILNKLIRTFDVNDEKFTIHIRKNDSEFKSLHRSSLDYYSIMDTILVIGSEHNDKLKAVANNGINADYKRCLTYEDYVRMQKPRARNKLKLFPYDISVEDLNGDETTVQFVLNGWIGTVSTLPELKRVAQSIVYEDEEDQDKITMR